MSSPITETEALLETWDTLSEEDRVDAFQKIPRAVADDFFLALNPRDQAALILSLQPRAPRIWGRLLAPDDATDVIQEAPEQERPGLLSLMDESALREVLALMAYKEGVAGGLMSPRFARLRPEMPVDEAIAYLRRQAQSGMVETVHSAKAVDSAQQIL